MEKNNEKEQSASAVDAVVIGATEIDRRFKDGEPCSRNCERHVTHPCERCGRVMAQGEVHFIEFNAEPNSEFYCGDYEAGLYRCDQQCVGCADDT